MSTIKETVYDQFILEDLIGQGGVGEVWKARGLSGDRKYALKMLRPQYLGNAKLRRRFTREARAVTKLSHENIATVYAFGVTEEPPFIAMELVEGPTLEKAIKTGISVHNIVSFAIQVASGLAHAHAKGVIHRDLKPENILLSRAKLPRKIGTAKIVDFGIATLDDYDGGERETQIGEVVGTPRYMSPEQAVGDSFLGKRSDIYAFGLLLYELIAGERPFGDASGLSVMSNHVHDRIPDLIPREGLNLDPDLKDIVRRALKKKPEERWNSCGELKDALELFLEKIKDDEDAKKSPGLIQRTSAKLSRITREVSGLQGSPLREVSQPIDLWQHEIPFVGRGEERAQLRFYADKTREKNAGSLIFLEGEAGVGKSRLANWLRENLEEEGAFRAHSGSFSPDAPGLGGARDILDSIFHSTGLEREKLTQKIQLRLDSWGHSSEEDLEILVNFLRPQGDENERQEGVTPDILFATVLRIFEYASQIVPLLIFFDDVHWASQGLFDFLDVLSSEIRSQSLRVLVVATVRREDLIKRPQIVERIQNLRKSSVVHRMVINRMGHHDGVELIQAILPSQPELVEIVLDRSSGNPLHLLMLLRYLREEKLLEWKEGRWFSNNLKKIKNAVPPSLGELFHARLRQADARFESNARLERVLQIAAFAGQRFRYDIVKSMLQNHGQTLQETFDLDLEHLVGEGFLVEIPGSAQEWYGFSHGLVCDFIVQNTPKDLAKELHKSAAISLIAAKDADTFAYEIAEHFAASENLDQAIDWYKRAGDDALLRFELYRTSSAFEAVLKIQDNELGIEKSISEPLGQIISLAELRQSNINPHLYLEILSRLGDLYEGFGDFETAERGYRRVVRLIGKDNKELEDELVRPLGYSWLGLGHIAWQRGDFEAAEWAFHKVREIVNMYSEQIMLDGEAVRGLARVFWYRGEYLAAEAMAEEAFELGKNSNHIVGQAEALWILGEIYRVMGKAEKARVKFEASMKLYATENSTTGSARNLLSLAQLARYQKNFSDARQRYSQTLAYYENLGDKRGQGQCYNGLGDIERFESHFGEAERYYTLALDLYTEIGVEYDMAVVMANLGINAMARGDFAAAKEYLSSAAHVIQSGDFPYLIAGIEYNLALANALGGELSEIDSLLALASKTKISDIDYAQPLERLANFCASKGRLNDAQALWKGAKEMYEDLGLDVDARRVQSYLSDH